MYSFLIKDYLLLSSSDGDDNNSNGFGDVDRSDNIDEVLEKLNKKEKDLSGQLKVLKFENEKAEEVLELITKKWKNA